MQKRATYIVIFTILQILVCFGLWISPAIAFTEDEQLFMQAWRIVSNAYLDETLNHQNWWSAREKTLKQHLDSRDAAYQAIDKLLATLDDPFTRFLRPEQYRSLQVSTSGELSGVGLQIGVEPTTGQIEVIAAIADSPAAVARIQSGDRILSIDRVPTAQMTLDEAANKMRGEAGTSVHLTIETPNQGARSVDLVRSRIALSPVAAKLVTVEGGKAVGYIRLSQFSANAPIQVKEAIQDLHKEGAKGYILDLRNNPGGLLQAGVEIARLWLNNGTIVYTVNRQGTIGSFDASGTALTDEPLVLLVNQGSASASEILAGALQENHRAKLLGEKTFGKGLIQSLFDLPDGSGLAVTVAKYETPNHNDIHKLGITPNQIVPLSSLPPDRVATETDLQYQAALQLLEAEVLSEVSSQKLGLMHLK
ncbi:carboxyl-terminal processing protease CtpA [Merismopedia glauca]|uniref:C-terminal processing peptidase n=1 Tax=Merismopedia glauca CCAP 1448/3 TaxID=1296344 RepID=A0A2T1C470_9CYAN|nr:carboxyl-terminal processing protease CtpA [Merismopedia glauca]PSB03082.1 carboxyl-terminal protease [Merismopedia glauca CCAP 1448/3]